MRSRILFLALLSGLMIACGGGSGGGRVAQVSSPAPLIITPGGVTLEQGGSQQFSVSGVSVTWSIQQGASGGTISSTGLYVAPNVAGTFFVIANSADGRTGTAAVTVMRVGININANSISFAPNESASLTSVVTVSGTVNHTIVWSVQGAPATGTITTAGVYTAPAQVGTYNIIATAQADMSVTAVVPISVLPLSIAISPSNDTLGPNGVRSFTASPTPFDQRVVWTIQEAPAGGAVAGNGTYTAPNTTGTFHVVAASVFDPSVKTTALVTVVSSGFQPTGSMNFTRTAHSATLLQSGKVLVAGGDACFFFDYYYGSCPQKEAELYDPSSGLFTNTGSMTDKRKSQTATLLGNNKVLIVAGTADLFDPGTGTFSRTGSMITARSSHTATLLPNGKVLIAGGQGTASALNSAEIYDTQTGTFASTGNLVAPRTAHTATLLANGKVLITGGVSGNPPVSQLSAELYDPVTGTFTATGNMHAARAFHSAVMLSSGKVLITGGIASQNKPQNTAEVYDPASGTFTATNTMIAARDSHFSIVLPSGNVLVAGGNVTGTDDFAAELYDPVTGVFIRTGSMEVGRILAAAVVLSDGRVLVTGGSDLNTAEIYK